MSSCRLRTCSAHVVEHHRDRIGDLGFLLAIFSTIAVFGSADPKRTVCQGCHEDEWDEDEEEYTVEFDGEDGDDS